jgi:hypothetical protein
VILIAVIRILDLYYGPNQLEGLVDRMAFIWTSELIATKSDKEIKVVRENALKKSVHEVVALCDAELLKRAPVKRQSIGKGSDHHNDIVIGYHFICRPEEKGVIRNSDGTAWSGTWVVAEANAEKSLKAGAYVALHLSHAEPSYLKGTVKAWRRTRREREYAEGQEVKTSIGTDFLIQITDDQIEWQGQGTVERSYVYLSDITPPA